MNDLIANGAQKWIFCHPDDTHLLPDLRPRLEYSTRVADVTMTAEEIRHLQILGKYRSDGT